MANRACHVCGRRDEAHGLHELLYRDALQQLDLLESLFRQLSRCSRRLRHGKSGGAATQKDCRGDPVPHALFAYADDSFGAQQIVVLRGLKPVIDELFHIEGIWKAMKNKSIETGPFLWLRPRNLWVSLAGMAALKCTAALVDSGFSDVAIL
jgi:hypothetical protein